MKPGFPWNLRLLAAVVALITFWLAFLDVIVRATA